MKKIVGIGIICYAVFMFIGCNRIDYSSNTTIQEPVVVEFWYGLTGNQGKMMELFIDEFNESQEDVEVIGVSQESYQVTSKAFKASVVKKSVPDVVLLEDSDMYEMANKGALMDLSFLIEQSATVQPSDYVQAFYEQNIIGDKVYALPIYGTTQVVYYRKDLFERHQIDVDLLNTWEGLEKAAKMLTKTADDNETIIYGFEPMQGRENIIDATINRGGQFISDDGKTMVINSEEWIYTFSKFKEWIHDEKIMKVNYGGEGWEYWYATIDDVMQGKAAGYIGSVADYKDLDFEMIGVHLRPHWEGFEENPTGVLNAHTICIPTTVKSKQAEGAFKWMEYITSEEVSARWSMETGYFPVRESSFELPEYKAFVNQNTGFLVMNQQRDDSTDLLKDPTGGKIYEALKQASVEIEVYGHSVEDVLNRLNQELQIELDKVNNRN